MDDGPRYEGSGRWRHENGVSAWQSRETWRPLPRREYTKRNDYDVLMGTHRHALTPTGWVHEQDSLKVVLGSTPYALARERGLNLYTRQPAEGSPPEPAAYWKQNQWLPCAGRGAWVPLNNGNAPLVHSGWSPVLQVWESLYPGTISSRPRGPIQVDISLLRPVTVRPGVRSFEGDPSREV